MQATQSSAQCPLLPSMDLTCAAQKGCQSHACILGVYMAHTLAHVNKTRKAIARINKS